jgi:branched-subunit amino acid ABC-type transport system permease component
MTFPVLQLLFNSLIIGSVYALVAVGEPKPQLLR